MAGLHRFLSGVLHAPGGVCVYGWPDHEENSLFAATLLAEVQGLRVSLLAKEPAAARRYLEMIRPGRTRRRGDRGIEVVAKDSLAGLLRASAAEVLLFTHGLYGSPDLTGRKLVVNLWHGYGPKANDNRAFAAQIPFTVLTCDTPVWGAAAARWLGARGARIRPVGNPRQVAFRLPPPPDALAKLGLERDRFVLWMPTYRCANGASGPAWRDAADLDASADAAGKDFVSTVAALGRAAGLKIVVKPHPLDSARYDRAGLRVIGTEEILRSGMTLYQFIAASAGMISDYSSVWVEYLQLDKPLILYCPDLSAYAAGRGFSEPTMAGLTPGLMVQTSEELEAFLQRLRAGEDWRPEQRQRARCNLEIQPAPPDGSAFTAAVLDELAHHRAAGGAGALSPKPPRQADEPSNDRFRRRPTA